MNKDEQGYTGINKEKQGEKKDKQGLTRKDKYVQGYTRINKNKNK